MVYTVVTSVSIAASWANIAVTSVNIEVMLWSDQKHRQLRHWMLSD
jgi:hypothetical protein